jgi:hypothetical protein
VKCIPLGVLSSYNKLGSSILFYCYQYIVYYKFVFKRSATCKQTHLTIALHGFTCQLFQLNTTIHMVHITLEQFWGELSLRDHVTWFLSSVSCVIPVHVRTCTTSGGVTNLQLYEDIIVLNMVPEES